MSDQVKTKMTAAEFFQLPETTQPTELIEGELIVSPSPIPEHQFANQDLVILLRGLIPHGRVVYAPMDVVFDDENTVQPDIFWVAQDGRCQQTDRHFVGPPELIIEILSGGSVRLDRVKKFQLYERHGVTEYWIVDPLQQYVEVYVLADGKYTLQDIYEAGDTFTAPVLGGKTVDLKQVFHE